MIFYGVISLNSCVLDIGIENDVKRWRDVKVLIGNGARKKTKSCVDGPAKTALAIAVGGRSCVGRGSTPPMKQKVFLEKAER